MIRLIMFGALFLSSLAIFASGRDVPRAYSSDPNDASPQPAAGVSGVLPWAVKASAADAAPIGEVVALHYTAAAVPGDDGILPLRIDGSGTTAYRASLSFGATSSVCAGSAPGCTPEGCPEGYPAQCAENSSDCDGPSCLRQAGNMVGPTRTAIDFRMATTSKQCDTFKNAFVSLAHDAGYRLRDRCNPWTGEGSCESETEQCSRRVILIPLVESFGVGLSPVVIERFALAWLDGSTPGRCQGNACEVFVRFVRTDITSGSDLMDALP